MQGKNNTSTAFMVPVNLRVGAGNTCTVRLTVVGSCTTFIEHVVATLQSAALVKL